MKIVILVTILFNILLAIVVYQCTENINIGNSPAHQDNLTEPRNFPIIQGFY